MDFDIRHLLTPYKLGKPVLSASGVKGSFDSEAVDVAIPFEHNGRFYMTFVGFDGIGYQTGLAVSDDLVNWEKLGVILPRNPERTWDKVGMACTMILAETNLFAPRKLKKINGKYWMTYHSYPGEGYETGPAEIGMAWSDDETLMNWHLLDEPVYSWKGGAPFEVGGLYASWIIEHEDTFYMFYNAKNRPEHWIEQTGVATSKDLIHWERYEGNPILTVDPNGWDSVFASDPKVFRDNLKNQWVMFYFGLGELSACDCVALSDDLFHWEKFPIPILTTGKPGCIDSKYAHKPGIIWHDGILYHFYCACDDTNRCISVARSKPWD